MWEDLNRAIVRDCLLNKIYFAIMGLWRQAYYLIMRMIVVGKKVQVLINDHYRTTRF